jgi:hypothetical protein
MFSPLYGTQVGYVEWMVLTPGNYNSTVFSSLVKDAFGSVTIPDGQYLYAYEVKSLVDGGTDFTVKADPATSIVKAGSSDINLELAGHDSTTFSNLGSPGPSEHHVADESNLVAASDPDVASDGTINWSFDLNKGQMTEALWFVGTSSPDYRSALYQAGKSTGDGEAATGDSPGTTQTPVPGALILGMFGLTIIGWIKRRL